MFYNLRRSLKFPHLHLTAGGRGFKIGNRLSFHFFETSPNPDWKRICLHIFFASNFEAKNKRKHLRKKRAVATSSKFLVMALQLSPSVIYYLLFNPSFSRKKVLLFHSARSLFYYHSFSQKKNSNGNEILHFWCKSAFQHIWTLSQKF